MKLSLTNRKKYVLRGGIGKNDGRRILQKAKKEQGHWDTDMLQYVMLIYLCPNLASVPLCN